MLNLDKLDSADLRLIQSGLNRFLPDRKPLAIDGITGKRTQASYDAYRKSLTKKPDNRVKSEFDKRTEKNLATLNPKVEPIFRQFIKEARELLMQRGLKYLIISGSRTFAEQDALFAKGRSKPGPKVTNARGGFSNHNFGIAVDGGIFRGSKYLDGSSKASERKEASRAHNDVSVIAKRLGLKWGGDWSSFRDEPHFEFPTGLTLAQMRARVKKGQSVVT